MIIDPRLAIGALLVAGSTAGVVALVSAADSTIEIYVAPHSLSPGDRLDASDLEVHAASVGLAANRYLQPGDIPGDGLVVTRPVGSGELVPNAAVGSPDGTRLAAIVVSTSGPLPTAMEAGVTVDLWAAREDESGVYDTPTILVPEAVVVRLVSAETIIAGNEVTAIELLVPQPDIARVLEAIANEAVLSIVPTSLPLGE